MRLGGLSVLWGITAASCIAAGSGCGGPRATGGASSDGSQTCAPRLLLESEKDLVDLFVLDEGILIVATDAVRLVRRDGQVARAVTWPRPISAAALTGRTLVIADQAALTVTTPALDPGPTAPLMETCAAGVLVRANRFVCGSAIAVPYPGFYRTFYTYAVDRSPPELIATFHSSTFDTGIPMRQVPGTDDFITVSTEVAPSDFHLFRLQEDGQVAYVNESPYHGDFDVTTKFAFDGTPASHVIQPTGLMLKIYGEGCDSNETVFSSGCFVKDGDLGTLWGQESFIGIDDDGAGKLYGVVASPAIPALACQEGCSFQHIDIASRAIVSQQTHVVRDLVGVYRVAGDPTCGNVVVAYDTLKNYIGFLAESFAY